jgi:hypothetical protein
VYSHNHPQKIKPKAKIKVRNSKRGKFAQLKVAGNGWMSE